MALPTSTFATYQAVGNREDLSDMIYRIDPTDTPFMSGAEKEKASAVESRMANPGACRGFVSECAARRRRSHHDHDHADGSSRQSLPDLLQGGAGVGHAAGGRSRRPRQRTGLSGNAQGSRAQARHRNHPGRHQPGQGHRRHHNAAQDGLDPVVDRVQHLARARPARPPIRLPSTAPAPAPTAPRSRSPKRG